METALRKEDDGTKTPPHLFNNIMSLPHYDVSPRSMGSPTFPSQPFVACVYKYVIPDNNSRSLCGASRAHSMRGCEIVFLTRGHAGLINPPTSEKGASPYIIIIIIIRRCRAEYQINKRRTRHVGCRPIVGRWRSAANSPSKHGWAYSDGCKTFLVRYARTIVLARIFQWRPNNAPLFVYTNRHQWISSQR